MTEQQTTFDHTLTLKEFSDSFGVTGALQTNEKYTWTNFQNKYMVIRYPLAVLDEPTGTELDLVFKQVNPIIISYVVKTDEKNAFNTYLYITHDQDYVLDKLKGPQRRTTKKALRSFEFKHITWDHFLEKGYKCYQDARGRNGLSDGSISDFKKMIELNRQIPSYKILAAIDPATNKLGAVLLFNHIEGLVTTTGHYSDNDFLIDRPNNGLFHFLKEEYLVTKKVNTIEYGYSSIQKSSNADSLHTFKTSIGFDSEHVSRKFVINPKYKILFNPVTKLVCNVGLKILPKQKYLLKLSGIFDLIQAS